MELKHYAQLGEFVQAANPLLLSDEVRHNNTLSRTFPDSLYTLNPIYKLSPYFVTLTLNGQVILAALLNDFFYIETAPGLPPDVLHEALSLLINDCVGKHTNFSCLSGTLNVVERFMPIYAQLVHGITFQTVMHTRAMSTEINGLKVCDTVSSTPGQMQEPTLEKHLDLLLQWQHDNYVECGFPTNAVKNRSAVVQEIGAKKRFIWTVDGVPVSMAGYRNVTNRTNAIRMVFTPMEHRKKGYATALTRALSLKLFGEGASVCCLLADVNNPTSNKIYQNLGFVNGVEVLLVKLNKGE